MLTGLVALVANVAAAGGGDCKKFHTEGTPNVCSVCKPHVEKTKEKKTCWKVVWKEICIPSIKCCCEKECDRKCGFVMKVKTLEQVEYECDKCEVKWEMHKKRCASCVGDDCDVGDCCDVGCAP